MIWIPQSNYMPGRNAAKVQRIVIHTTVGTFAAAVARFQNASAQVSAHFIVKPNGEVEQFVDEADTAFHAGDWSVNLTSIGIEHVDDGDYNGVRPDALYTASAKLVRTLSLKYGLDIDRTTIVGHREVHPTACPDALDIDRIVREAQGGTMTAQETYDLIAPLLQKNVVAPQNDTNIAIKEALTAIEAEDKAAIATALTKVGQALERGALLLDADAAK